MPLTTTPGGRSAHCGSPSDNEVRNNKRPKPFVIPSAGRTPGHSCSGHSGASSHHPIRFEEVTASSDATGSDGALPHTCSIRQARRIIIGGCNREYCGVTSDRRVRSLRTVTRQTPPGVIKLPRCGRNYNSLLLEPNHRGDGRDGVILHRS